MKKVVIEFILAMLVISNNYANDLKASKSKLHEKYPKKTASNRTLTWEKIDQDLKDISNQLELIEKKLMLPLISKEKELKHAKRLKNIEHIVKLNKTSKSSRLNKSIKDIKKYKCDYPGYRHKFLNKNFLIIHKKTHKKDSLYKNKFSLPNIKLNNKN